MIHLPLAIDPAHPAFEGHFPAFPIVPGAVLLDHGLRAIAAYRAADYRAAEYRAAAYRAADYHAAEYRAADYHAAEYRAGAADPCPTARCRIGAAKFLSFVRPGESLRLEIESSGDAATPDVLSFRLRIFAGSADAERLALSGSVAFERTVTG